MTLAVRARAARAGLPAGLGGRWRGESRASSRSRRAVRKCRITATPEGTAPLDSAYMVSIITHRSPRILSEPPRRLDQPLPPPARRQPGRLVAVDTRGLRGGEAPQRAHASLDRLRRLPLVPCHGARELFRSGDRRGAQPRISSPSRSIARSGRRSTRSTCARCMRLASRAAGRSRCSSRPTPSPSGAAPIFRRSRAMAGRAFARSSTPSPTLGRSGDEAVTKNVAALREHLNQPVAPPGGSLDAAILDQARRDDPVDLGPRARQLPRCAEIPKPARARYALAWLSAADRRGRYRDAVARHTDLPLPGRHLRSCRRRLCPLLGRCRNGSSRISKRCSTTTASCSRCCPTPTSRQAALFRTRIEETVELARPRDAASRRRLRLEPRRRYRARGGADLRLVLGRAAGGARRGFRSPSRRIYDVTPGGNFEGSEYPQPPRRDCARMAGRRRGAPPRRAAGQAA